MADANNTIFNGRHSDVYQDMSQPLCHYFIATSHNTYLTKDQLKSKSSVDNYINALRRGCKCLEIDCWDGPDNEPIVYHGHTLTSKIYFKDVIIAIRDYAFCVSRYPVILSFENHCSVEQQKTMARHLTTILGKMLHTQPVPEDARCLPSPSDLQGYVLVKAKRLEPGLTNGFSDDFDDDFSDEDDDDAVDSYVTSCQKSKADAFETSSIASNDSDSSSTSSMRRRRTLEDLVHSMRSMEVFRRRKVEKKKVPKVAKELSDLVTYCRAVGFHSFEHSRVFGQPHHMSSFGERKATKVLSENPIGFLRYNQCHLSRIFPAGFRIDSSNYDPMTFWTVGCQMVALNYQTPCFEMQVNQGLFQDNGGCGYVLKPQFMREGVVSFDPHGVFQAQYEISLKGLRGHHIKYAAPRLARAELYLLVQIRTTGIGLDTTTTRTELLSYNGESPVWNDELLLRVFVPQLTVVQFAVYKHVIVRRSLEEPTEIGRGFVRIAIRQQASKLKTAITREQGSTVVDHQRHNSVTGDGKITITKETLIGQYTLPFGSIVPGNHRIQLQDKHSVPLTNSYLQANVNINKIK